jgi:RNA polymerase sigma-70 factor (ECF subfamily)
MATASDSGRNPESPATISTSTSLLERVKGRDQEAWQRLIDLHGPLVYQWTRQSGVLSEDAADVFQEVFASVATHLAEFRRDRPGDTFLGWLRTITRNKIRDHFRRRKGQPMAQGGTQAKEILEQIPDGLSESVADGCAPGWASSIAQLAAQMVRDSVEDRTWQAFWCLAIEDRKAADVAEELGMNVRAVYESKYRVMRKLREEMNGLTE